MKLRKQKKQDHTVLLKALQTYYNQSISRMEVPWRRCGDPSAIILSVGGLMYLLWGGWCLQDSKSSQVHPCRSQPKWFSLHTPREPLRCHNGKLDHANYCSKLSWLIFLKHSCLTALGLLCGMQDLWSSLQHVRSLVALHTNSELWHVGSSSLTRDWTWGPCAGSLESLHGWLYCLPVYSTPLFHSSPSYWISSLLEGIKPHSHNDLSRVDDVFFHRCLVNTD